MVAVAAVVARCLTFGAVVGVVVVVMRGTCACSNFAIGCWLVLLFVSFEEAWAAVSRAVVTVEAVLAKATMTMAGMAGAAATRLGLSSSERAVKLSLHAFEWAAG